MGEAEACDERSCLPLSVLPLPGSFGERCFTR
jgi:hypothetical protein